MSETFPQSRSPKLVSKLVSENWHDDEELENNVYGMLAEFAMADLLYELGIASLYNDVIFQDLVGKKPFDFGFRVLEPLRLRRCCPEKNGFDS